MSRYVDLDEKVTAQFYDEQYEEWTMQTVTIEDVLESVCDEHTVLPSTQPEGKKGVFIPDITVEMLRKASLEAVEDLLTSGEMKDIVLPSAQPYTEEQIQKLQDLEQAQLEEAYRRGYEEGQSDIILCKDCVKHNKGHGRYLDGTVIGIKDCCPLVEIRGIAKGHEFDYQYCAYAERRADEQT